MHLPPILLALLLFAVIHPYAHGKSSDGLILIHEGVTTSIIVIDDHATPLVRYAAEELADHLERAAEVRLPIVRESEVPDTAGVRLHVGPTRASRAAGLQPDASNSESFVLATRNNALFLLGHEETDHTLDPLDPTQPHSGTLWAVYEFLEQIVGVRWLWPGEAGTAIPRQPHITIPLMDRVESPALGERSVRSGFRWRKGRFQLNSAPGQGQAAGLGFSDAYLPQYTREHLQFLRRHRLGRSSQSQVGSHALGWRWWQEYGEAHPEWFQLNADGSRGPLHGRGVSMCVSNPQLHAEIIRRWVHERSQHPDTVLPIHIGEGDTTAKCICAPCRAWDAPQKSQDDIKQLPYYAQYHHWYAEGDYTHIDTGRRYALFAKRVHELASPIDPDAIVTGFIYLNYFVAPTDLDLHQNIVLGFVPWHGWWFPRADDEQQWLKDQWDAWRQTGATLYYRPNYLLDAYTMPHIFSHQMGDFIQHAWRNGAVAMDFDSLTGQWAAQGPTLYLLMRLLWRPDRPIDDLLDEYYAAFGPARQHVQAYFDHWNDHSNRHSPNILGGARWRGGSAKLSPKIYTDAAFDQAQIFLDRAVQALAGHPEGRFSERLQFLQAGLDHARLCVRVASRFEDPETSAGDRQRALDELVAFRRAHEHLNIANFAHAAYVERDAWKSVDGFPVSE